MFLTLPSWRGLCTMSADEVQAANAAGVDVQLDAHHHEIPEGPRMELVDNRPALAAMGVGDTVHSCTQTAA
jgi:hypothetical protein